MRSLLLLSSSRLSSSLLRGCLFSNQLYLKFGAVPWIASRHGFASRSTTTYEDLGIIEHEDEAIKYKELLSRYSLHDISTSQNIFFVHPFLKTNPRRELMDESIELLRTLQWSVHGKISLPVPSFQRKILFDSDQVQEIKSALLKDKSARVGGIFVNGDSLFSGHRIELEEELFGLPIFDRYSVVLQIFKQHARTREAKLQVSLAEIPYIRRRLNGDHAQELGNKHSKSRKGESYFQTHIMDLNKRETRIKNELRKLKDQRSMLRQSRSKFGTPTVAVVGYTNSGKTTLIKSFTGSDKLQPQDKLFATLDVTLHGGTLLDSRQKVLFIDTVGFISDIPVNLIASFASTLEDALNADLLIHVRDASHPDSHRQSENVHATLKSIFKGRESSSSSLSNMIVVNNKVDKLEVNDLEDLISKEPHILPISAANHLGIRPLATLLEKRILEVSQRKPYTLRVRNGGKEYLWIRKHFPISGEVPDQNDLNYIVVKTVIRELDFKRFRSHFVSSDSTS
eukprot:TRINITY_DN5259_c0_g1_i1.p1 TRINITY_DN5259_c0_g1~~TRINITY_DN5259_c0_g1_i1.p1  ORF type:complete len:511 (-),score=120.95 TRINITY_DN5259_c0_g1_i1:43-1575(-)